MGGRPGYGYGGGGGGYPIGGGEEWWRERGDTAADVAVDGGERDLATEGDFGVAVGEVGRGTVGYE